MEVAASTEPRHKPTASQLEVVESNDNDIAELHLSVSHHPFVPMRNKFRPPLNRKHVGSLKSQSEQELACHIASPDAFAEGCIRMG